MLSTKVYNRCQYRDCKNIRSDEIKLFHFPQKTDPRCEIWLTNCGKEHYLRKWTPSSLKKAGICFEHFWPEAFWDNTRKRLRPKQNPFPYAPAEQKRMDDISDIGQKEKDTEAKTEDENRNFAGNKGEEEETVTETVYELDTVTRTLPDTLLRLDKTKVLKTYPSAVKDKSRISCLDEEIDQMNLFKMEPPFHTTSSDTQKECTLTTYVNTESITKDLTKKYKKLKSDDEKMLTQMRKKILLLKQKLQTERSLRKREIAALKRKKFSISEFLDAHNCTNNVSRAIITMQLRKGKRPFTADELDLAKQMYRHSPKMYRQLVKAGLKLPTPSLMRHVLAAERLREEQKPTFV